MKLKIETIVEILNSSIWSNEPMSDDSLRDIARHVGAVENEFVHQYNVRYSEVANNICSLAVTVSEFGKIWGIKQL